MAVEHLAAEVICDVLEVAGTFLLAVEAIKLENLKKLRERFFARIMRAMTPKAWVRRDASQAEINDEIAKVEFQAVLFIAVAGIVILLFAIRTAVPLDILWLNIGSQTPESWWGKTILAVGAALILLALGMVIGMLVYKLVLFPFQCSVNALEWIEAQTAAGVIGILGFFLFLCSVILRAWVTA